MPLWSLCCEFCFYCLFQMYLLVPLQMKSSEEALLMPGSQSEHLLLGLLEKLEHVLQKMDLLVLLMLQNS